MPIDPHLYLASRSPRRAELLRQIGLRFTVVGAETDESRRLGESPLDYVRRVALEKARAGRAVVPAGDVSPVLAADTAVVVDERILGKPRDQADAARMLALLSGRSHRVLTAVALVVPREKSRNDAWLEVSESRVTFRAISEEEACWYWRTGEPLDKAGGYGIQGLGALFVAGLEGSYSGVMGLPLFGTGRLLERAGIVLTGLVFKSE